MVKIYLFEILLYYSKEGGIMIDEFIFSEKENYIKEKIQFLPPYEIFIKVSSKIVPGIKDYYWISNYGNLYSSFKNGLINPGIDSKGYYYAALATDHGSKNMRIHRLVLMTFSYFPGCENTIINHLDGIKTNCFVWNLEWSTFSDNVTHAYNFGLISRYSKNRSLSNTEVENICILLSENKLSCVEIANMFNINVDMIYSIKNRRSYLDISEKYIFHNTSQLYDNSFIENICKIISENKPYKRIEEMNIKEKQEYYKYICLLIPIEYNQQSVDLIRRIYRKESFANISNKYKF